ncbi:MAG: hypothetical protein AAGD13_08915 [Pseudomonadota bacterium]
MVNINEPIADALKVIDFEAFGRQIVKWALQKDEGVVPARPLTIGDIRANFSNVEDALSIPANVEDTDTIEFIQGRENHHVFVLPPIYKLLPMLDYLEKTPADLGVPTADQSAEVQSPTPIPTVPSGGVGYAIPDFYQDNTLSEEERFMNRVGDYSFNGCR